LEQAIQSAKEEFSRSVEVIQGPCDGVFDKLAQLRVRIEDLSVVINEY
jgi:hypothetical protein